MQLIKTINRKLATMSVMAFTVIALIGWSLQQSASTQVLTNNPPSKVQHDKPNIIYIIVDDLGIGDIEPYGQQKISTPNLQVLANEGLTFVQHYAGNTVCAPSRAALMTGLHSGHNQIRGNYELGDFTDEREFGQMPLNPGSTTLGTVMQSAGYHTALIGKWGLGGPSSYGTPNKQGFDYFLATWIKNKRIIIIQPIYGETKSGLPSIMSSYILTNHCQKELIRMTLSTTKHTYEKTSLKSA